MVGSTEIPTPWLDASEADAKYVHKLQYEMWGMTRTEVLKQYLNPNIAGMRFYPESSTWIWPVPLSSGGGRAGVPALRAVGRRRFSRVS